VKVAVNERRYWVVILTGMGVVLAIAGVEGVQRLAHRPPEEAPAAEAPTAAEANPQTNKVVLEESTPSADEVDKAVSGQVVAVHDRVLVLEAEGDRLQILVDLDAHITRTVFSSDSPTPQMAAIGLEEIQNGQQVDALVRVREGQALATNVNVRVGP
jgi:hypothetical protein